MSNIFTKNPSLKRLGKLTGELLFDADTLNALTQMIDDAQFDTEPGSAREYFIHLSKLVEENKQQLSENRVLYRKYLTLVWESFWKAVPLFGEDKIVKALSTHLIFAIENNMPLKEGLSRYLSLYEFGLGPAERERKSLVKSLESNQELLGSKKIKVAGQYLPPTISNWLKDYNTFTSSAARRGGYEKVNYTNNSPNTKVLSVEDRQVLRQIVSLYDWLRYPSNVPMPKTEYGKSIEQKTADLPKTPQSESQKVEARPQPKIQPVAQPKKLREVSRRNVSSSSALEDALVRAKIRIEAGLDIPSDQAQGIIELIKQKKN